MSPWVVPGYSEEKQLGRGASGRVVAAVHLATGQRVAIKYLTPKLFNDPDFLAGFRAEADLLRSLDNPYVVRLFDYVEAPGQGAAIVMELVDGVSLHEMISRQGATSPEAALVVLKGSLLGLGAAHALGIVHRDYKPENVLVDGEGNSKLSDFGVAVKEGRQVPSAGTPLYMAPEQWDGMAATPATDIYAASAVFFECLTGKTPFSGRIGQLQAQHAASVVPVELVDEPLRGMITRGMAKNPAERPRNAMAFVTELESTAAAAYGMDWESRGRSHLKERAAALLLLLIGAGAVGAGAGGTVAGSWLASHLSAAWLAAHKTAAIIAATVTAAVVAGATVTAVALSGGGSHPTVTAGQTSHPTVSPSGPASSGSTSSGGSTVATFGAMVSATPPVASSACATPTTFTFSADLSATAPGTVSYKWVYSTGKSGPVQQATFSAAGTQPVSGGTVSAMKDSTGWAAIQIVKPASVLSNKATYRLLCKSHASRTTTANGIGLSAFVSPGAATVACGSAPPSFTFSGLISSQKAGTVTYHWALSDGATSPPATLTFSGAGQQAVQGLTVTPAADTASGSGVIVVTSPGTETSSPVSYSLTCTSTPPPPLHVTLAAQVSQAASTVSCGSAPPTLTFTGSITASRATTVSYFWRLPSGNGATHTLTFASAGTLAVAPATFTPASDTASGSGTIIVTSPFATASGSAPFTVTCVQPNLALSITSSPASPATVTCGSPAPVFTFTGTISSDRAIGGVSFQWTEPNGHVRSGTLSLGAGSVAVKDTFQPPTVTSPKVPYSGTETLAITAPFHVSQSLLVQVSCSSPAALAVSGSLHAGTAGAAYSGAGITASGGTSPYTFTAAGLPSGLSMSPDGTVSGTPAEPGTYMVVVMATNRQQPTQQSSTQFTMVIN